MEEETDLEVLRYPKITFGVSELERDRRWRKELKEHLQKFEPEWRKVEDKVLSAFEEVTTRDWPREERVNFTVTIIGEGISSSRPGGITLQHRDWSLWAKKRDKKGEVLSTQRQTSTLVHELAHRFTTSQIARDVIKKFLPKVNKDNLKSSGGKYSNEKMYPDDISAASHVYVNLLWKSVMERCFSQEIVKEEEERARELSPVYAEAWKIIDSLSEEEKTRLLQTPST